MQLFFMRCSSLPFFCSAAFDKLPFSCSRRKSCLKSWVMGHLSKHYILIVQNFYLLLYNSLMSEAPSNSQEKAVRNFTLNKEAVMHLRFHQG